MGVASSRALANQLALACTAAEDGRIATARLKEAAVGAPKPLSVRLLNSNSSSMPSTAF
jgi:hypothetical protein